MVVLSTENSTKIQSALVEFAQTTVENFLSDNLDKKFYAMAFECNLTYGEFGICLNTEDDFLETLNYYCEKYPEDYETPEQIQSLKYNTGDWKYQYIDVMYFMTEEELDKIFQSFDDDFDKVEKFLDELKCIVNNALIEFKQTEVYQKIAKTEDFIAFVIDHDDDPSEVLAQVLKF